MRVAHVAATLALLCCGLAGRTAAAQLEPFVSEGRLGVRILDLAYPPTLQKDLLSGLTNRLLLRVELLAGTRIRAQSMVEVTVSYDLWDENFHAAVMADGHGLAEATYPDLAHAQEFLKSLQLPALFAAADSEGTETMLMRVTALLNPIERERMEHIRKWVRENSTPSPSDPTTANATAPLGAAPSSALFDRIFAQFASGANLAAAWQETAISGPFRIENIPHEIR